MRKRKNVTSVRTWEVLLTAKVYFNKKGFVYASTRTWQSLLIYIWINFLTGNLIELLNADMRISSY